MSGTYYDFLYLGYRVMFFKYDFGLLYIDTNEYKIKKKFNFFFLFIILFLSAGVFYYIKNNTYLFKNKNIVSKIDSIRTEQKNIDSTII